MCPWWMLQDQQFLRMFDPDCVAIERPERQVRKASHCGSKQQ